MAGRRVDRIGRSPELAQQAHAIVRSCLERRHADGRLGTDVDFAARAMQAASGGVMALYAQGAGREEIEATSAFLFDATRLLVQ